MASSPRPGPWTPELSPVPASVPATGPTHLMPVTRGGTAPMCTPCTCAPHSRWDAGVSWHPWRRQGRGLVVVGAAQRTWTRDCTSQRGRPEVSPVEHLLELLCHGGAPRPRWQCAATALSARTGGQGTGMPPSAANRAAGGAPHVSRPAASAQHTVAALSQSGWRVIWGSASCAHSGSGRHLAQCGRAAAGLAAAAVPQPLTHVGIASLNSRRSFASSQSSSLAISGAGQQSQAGHSGPRAATGFPPPPPQVSPKARCFVALHFSVSAIATRMHASNCHQGHEAGPARPRRGAAAAASCTEHSSALRHQRGWVQRALKPLAGAARHAVAERASASCSRTLRTC